VSIVGLADIPVEYQESRGYKQHGVTVLSWSLTPRSLAFAFEETARTPSGLWAQRQALIDVLKPNTGIVTFRRVFRDGARRDIDGWIEAGMSMIREGGLTYDVAFSLRCPDPSFYDPTEQSNSLTMAVVEAFALPFALPDDMYIGDGTSLTATVDNPGTWRAYPTITITGPYSRLVLTNNTTGASFTLGVALDVSETMVIDLTPGAITIERDGVSALDEVEGGNFVDWYLESGDNEVVASGSGIDINTTVTVSSNPRYIAL